MIEDVVAIMKVQAMHRFQWGFGRCGCGPTEMTYDEHASHAALSILAVVDRGRSAEPTDQQIMDAFGEMG